jgi:hypothetical protein
MGQPIILAIGNPNTPETPSNLVLSPSPSLLCMENKRVFFIFVIENKRVEHEEIK